MTTKKPRKPKLIAQENWYIDSLINYRKKVKEVPKQKSKQKLREYWLLESEYGLDFKRYIRSIHPSLEEAESLKNHLDIKNPYDKHYIIHLKERAK